MPLNQELTAATAHVLHVGLCQIETASRELAGPASPRVRRITPKALAVLRVLAAANGHVVGRDELLAEVWHDSDPTDDVLTQAITHLRKAFTAADGSTPYIETIARSGYRLLVDVRIEDPEIEPTPHVMPHPPSEPVLLLAAPQASGPAPETAALPAAQAAEACPATEADAPAAAEAWAAAPAAPMSPPAAGAVASLHPRKPWRTVRRRVLAVFGLLLLASTVLLSLMLWKQRSPPPLAPSSPLAAAIQRPYRLLTSTPEAESTPAVSPDGESVAYGRAMAEGGTTIQVQRRAVNSPARPLTDTPAGVHDRYPAWSPDGRQIAFARFQPDGRCEVMLADVEGLDPAHTLLHCDGTELLSFDWTPDGRALLFGSMAAGGSNAGIALFHLDDGRWQALDYPRAPGDLDFSPRMSPDGRWLVFARNPQLGRLYRMPAEGGPLQPMGDELAEIRGLTWLHDSRHVVVGRWVGLEMRLFRLDTVQGSFTDLGLDDAQMPAAARAAPVLAFVHRQAQLGLAAMIEGEPLRRLYAGTGRDTAPILSPDGQQLLLLSDRNGVPALWWGSADGQGPLKLVPGLHPDSRQPPDWSADNRHALVIGQDDEQGPGLYEINPQNGSLERLPVPTAVPPLQAVYTDNPVRLLVLERGADRGRLVLYDRSSSPWQALAALDGVSQVRWDRAGEQAVFTRFDQPGLFAWSLRAALPPQQLNARLPTRWGYRNWTLDAAGRVWYAHAGPGCKAALGVIAGAGQGHGNGTGPTDLRCLDRLRAAAPSGIGISPDGQTAVVGLTLRDASDIGLMNLSETAYSQFGDSGKLLIP